MSISSSFYLTSTEVRQATILRGKPSIANQLLGHFEVDATTIQSYEDFESIFSIRHDLIHSLICSVRGIPFGEKKVSEILKDVTLESTQYWDLVKNQTPDYFEISGKFAHIIEVSISRSPKMEKEKMSKYALLVYFLKKNNYTVKMEVIVVNPDFVYHQRETLIIEHKIE